MPLMDAEVLRVRQALTKAAAELEAVLLALQGAGPGDLGSPAGESAVASGLADLVAVAQLLRDQSQDCVRVADRHLTPPSEDPAP